MALREQAVAIAVIGVTGSGKSAFITVASGSNLPINESLGGCTTKLKSSTFSFDGRTVMLIDTPGFGDPTPSILEVLKLISDHVSGLQGVKLAGVIYMHCLAEDHMRSSSSHNFLMFSKFCGDTSLRDVLVVTNKQESTDKDEFFELVADKGARVLYHDGSQSSAHAILRHLLRREYTVTPAQDGSSGQKTDLGRTTTGTSAVRELMGQAEHHMKTLRERHQRIDATTLTEDEKAKQVPQEEAKNSLENIEYIRHELEQMVVNIAAENSRLEDENCRYKNDSIMQKAEGELRIRLLGEERRAREIAEARRERAEAQLAEERALWERQRTESLREHAGIKYDKLFAGGALIFLLLYVSRFAFHGSPLPL